MNVFVVGAKPTGKNINVGCGSQHTEKLSRLVRAKKCDLGIAFDGDGDCLILVDEKGSTLDGDHIIALLARTWKRLGTLKKNTVVITVMANLGLKKVLKKMSS
jgi:phosphoglucosamine mutase